MGSQSIPRHILVSNKQTRNIVYQDVPKCACTYIRKSLIKWMQPSCNIASVPVHRWKSYPHLDFDGFSDSFRFSFVRSPIDRIVSVYQEKIRLPDYSDGNFINGISKAIIPYGFTPGMPFIDFVEHICGIPDQSADSHFKSIYSLLTLDEILPLPDDIILTSHIDEYLSLLDKTIAPGLLMVSRKISESLRNRSLMQPGISHPVEQAQIALALPFIKKRYEADFSLIQKSANCRKKSSLMELIP